MELGADAREPASNGISHPAHDTDAKQSTVRSLPAEERDFSRQRKLATEQLRLAREQQPAHVIDVRSAASARARALAKEDIRATECALASATARAHVKAERDMVARRDSVK